MSNVGRISTLHHTCQSKFVRSLHQDDDHPPIHMPFLLKQFGAVLMVDIVGFSQMTSIASSKGDVGAEMLSSQIGAYMDMAIRIIEYHGGDVVKFLGDALLVVFQPDPVAGRTYSTEHSPTIPDDDPAVVLRRNKVIVRRAVECGLELLAKLSNYRIYLSEYEFSRKLSIAASGTSEDAYTEDSHGNTIGNGTGMFSANSIERKNNGGGASGNGLDHLFMTHANSSGSTTEGRSVRNEATSSRRTSLGNNYNSSGVSGGGGHVSGINPPVMTRVMAGTGPGLGGVPLVSVTPSSIPSSVNNSLPSLHSASNTIAGPSGVAAFRKREESFISSRPASTSSRLRAGAFLTNAKNLFTHATSSDRQGGGAGGEVMTENWYPAEDSHDLQLHMALSAGEISNIIIGDLGSENGLDNLLVQNTGRLEYAICGEQMATIDDALNMARAGEVTVTKSAWKYVNADSYPGSEPRRNCFILKNIQPSVSTDLPLPRRIKSDKLLNTPVESNPHYYKYINKSATHRLILYPDSDFPAQFRNATILFVSLGDVKPWTPEGLELCQKAILVVHKVTSTYEGFIQQFAVDDKGATLLCAFGLPYPRSHEKEAVFAAKSAWTIRMQFLEEGIRGFKISLATGVIFTSMIGNEFRRDPAIVGDTIVVAVRILKVDYAIESVVCDDATMAACTLDHDSLCQFKDMGEEYVKGKIHPLRIWKLVHFGAKKQTRRPNDVMVDETIGYEPEREKVSSFISAWAENPDRNTILVTGPKGSGKSMFYQQICHIADDKGYQICSAASAEVEKNTEYYPIKFLLLGIFDIMRKHHVSNASKPMDKSATSSTTPLGAIPEDELATNNEPAKTPATIASSDTAMTDISTTSIEEVLTPSTLANGSDRRRSSAFSVDMALSPTLSQYEEPSARQSTSLTKLQVFISVCLSKIGSCEDSNVTMPVLNRIISAISLDNSTPVMDIKDDKILAEFIVRILNYASVFVKIIVMLEDAQWCDVKSLNIYKTIHEQCPNVLLVIFTRPQRDYGGLNILSSVTNHPRHLEIALEGLKRREIEVALIKAFRSNGVTRISPEVIELVQQRTRGNPKFVKNMSDLLKEFYHVNIVDGELVTTGQESTASPISKAMEEMVLKQDRKKMTLMQYDRLQPKFQDFLKIASCLGERFSLAEVSAIKPLETLLGPPDPGKTYARVLSDLDTYKFLSMATEQQRNILFSSNVVLQTIYQFGSESIAKDIYDSIPYEERVGYHLKLAQFYESFLERALNDDPIVQPLNCQDLLPQITKHYLKTDNTEKKIKYLKALSAYNLKSNMLTDTTKNVNELIHILDTERGAREMVSKEDLADVYGIKGESLSRRMRIEEAEPALLESLAQYGVYWPATRKQWRLEVPREWFKFWFNYHRGVTPTRNRRGKPPHKVKVDLKAQVRFQRIICVFSCLQNIFFWRTQPEAALLSCLYTLHYSRKLGQPSSDQTVSLGRIALLLYFQGKKRLCEKYMSESRQMTLEGESTDGMLPALDAYVEYCEGRHEKAHKLLDLAINESKNFGVVTHLATFYRAVTMKTAYRMWEGAFNAHPEDCQLLRTLSAVAIQNGDSEGETLFAVPTLANLLLQDRLRDAESWVVLIEKYIMPKARLMNLLVIHGVLSFYYAKTGNYDKSWIYVELLGEEITEQGVGAHPFPMMSCMFTLMSMYEMHDNVRPQNHSAPASATASASTTEVDSMSPMRGGMILTRIIAYLKTDPFKVIANVCICLAEAMRCFIHPNHVKEGAQKLAQGYRELGPSLKEIHFVDAYFLTQLGRHSGPCTKDEYYKRAHYLFKEMSINPLVWLTDPTPSWLPPPLEEGRFDFIFGKIPIPIKADLEEGTLGWAAAEIGGRGSRTSIESGSGNQAPKAGSGKGIVPRLRASTALPHASLSAIESGAGGQELWIGKEMMFRHGVTLDENSFDSELMTAARCTGPTVHDISGEGIRMTEYGYAGFGEDAYRRQ
ncbi:hypothetical protein BGZ51_006432 [Haplosporangium sp. Z 767]|nr:hypothetical protein BGZ51_006432 [Haplosporangium sp. Z 767]